MICVGTAGLRAVKDFVVEVREVADWAAHVSVRCEGQMRLVGPRWIGFLRVTKADDPSMIGDTIQINMPRYGHLTNRQMGNYFLKLMREVFPEFEVGCVRGLMGSSDAM